jgi:hemerythrin superfamily protein
MDTETIRATDFILEQHAQIRRLFDGVADAVPEARAEAFKPLVRLLAVHETAEEMVIYPAIERSGEQGKAVAASRKSEEDMAKVNLADLEQVDPASDEFLTRLQMLRKAVEAHAEAEEREVLPLLEQVADDEGRQRAMAKKLQLAEAMAPTHPHKRAPESALGNLLVGPFVAMADRVRDAIRDARD